MTRIVASSLKIGMEIHVELATASKMFTRTPNIAHPDHYEAPANSLVDPVVAALPGVLPVMNKRAVEMSIMVGLALGSRIASFSKWDRKNYFYPDLPKGYQISQYDLPLCEGGSVEITTKAGEVKSIGIIRAHLEEDTGKLGHELPGGGFYEGSLVDLNRAGTPLLEIVSEPDMTSAEEAVLFGQELRNLCMFLGVTGGVMQRGHMRFEPNINLLIQTDDGQQHATPIVEVKNLNSFKAVHAAIGCEATRQLEQWQADGQVQGPGTKRTRGWDDKAMVTVLQREKEDAHDYRYLPDPDLVPVVISDAWREQIAASVPELPRARRQRYIADYELPASQAGVLTSDRQLCLFFEACVLACEDRGIDGAGSHSAKLLLNAGSKRANGLQTPIAQLGITPTQVAELLELRQSDQIGSTAADDLFGMLCESDRTALELANSHGLLQVRDESQLESWVDQAIAAHPQAAEDFAAGKDAAAGRLVGQAMKASGGQADAKAIQQKLRERLRS